ncbi:DUF6470 family protein [Salisediminibacterium selenitireducens]|uniref:YviE n=1 Tax=Bacillus selenitireducens (strain ATCC 700615 / DSM 15326 / MLS10) TaxID=439292 RepID=D6Y0F8_BACIE|nr:DUF6470 family protein [Salisediminibacterium selenitireducens]ADH98549.1 hypothetical protein Bsel_1029 [[Bacillus] selenitireducens MLS10]
MDLPRIQIQTTRAETALQSHRPPMSIQQPKADMQIDNSLSGRFRMTQEYAEISIDQTEAFADADVKSILRRNDEWTSRAMQQAMTYTAKVARQGEQLKKIENPGDVIPQLARQNGERPPKSYNYGQVPSSTDKVRVSYAPGDIRIDLDWPDANIRVQRNDPVINIPRWETNVYLQQRNSIQFQAVGGHVNMLR